MSDEPRPYPEKGDQLFRGDWDIALNADISHWNKDLHAYATGYRTAADLIVQNAATDPTTLSSHASYLVFPVVFLYRQYLELRLKEIIIIGSRLYGKKPMGYPKHHKIAELWSHARPYLERVNPRDPLDAVENCIEEFSSLDPDGSAFRYPMRLSGESTIPQDWIVINLRHLGEIMTKLGNLLDDSSEALFIRWEQEEEVRDEW